MQWDIREFVLLIREAFSSYTLLHKSMAFLLKTMKAKMKWGGLADKIFTS